jgi:hypothetical protein
MSDEEMMVIVEDNKTPEEVLKDLVASMDELTPVINGAAKAIDDAVNDYLMGTVKKQYNAAVWAKFVNITGAMFVTRKLITYHRLCSGVEFTQDMFEAVLAKAEDALMRSFNEYVLDNNLMTKPEEVINEIH